MNANRIGLVPRLIAGVLDGLILIIPVYVVYLITPWYYLAGIIVPLLYLAYFFLDVKNGATPGKQIMKLGIRLTDGAAASQEQLLKRYLVKMSPTILVLGAGILGFPYIGTPLRGIAGLYGLAYGIYCLTLIVKPHCQAYHDLYAGTAVYNVEELATATVAPASTYADALPVPDMGAVAPPPPPPAVG